MPQVRELTDARTEGWRCGQSSTDKGAFFGVNTVTGQQAAVTTVDSTTVTTVATATITTVAATTNSAWQAAAEADIQLHAETINKLVADSRAQAVAINDLIGKLQNLGLLA